jgi:hypothetical protein
MNIHVNTGHNVSGRADMVREATMVVETTLGHLANHITRIEVHLSDEVGKKKGGHDKRCMIEARLKGHQPVAVTHEGETFGQIIGGAAEKLKNVLDHTLGRLMDRGV